MADFFAFGTGGLQETAKQLFAKLKPLLDGKYTKPSGGIPKTDLAQAVQTSLGKADTALQEHQSLAAYRTAAAQDVIDSNKAPVILDTASGSVASFPDGADGLPLKTLVVNIEPMQAGSGDPSPENVRPISGWTGCEVTRTGKNLVSKISDGRTNNSVTYTPNQNGGIQVSCSSASHSKSYSTTNALAKTFILDPGTYTLSANVQGTSTSLYVAFLPTGRSGFVTRAKASQIFTLAEKTEVYIAISVEANGTSDETIYPMLEFGSTASAYEPFGQVYPITFPSGTAVYGGTLTINEDGTGELRKRPYYASYDGETLVGPWLSSMDIYAEGATPTIGAQVVDLGGEETVYQLTNQPAFDTLCGTNNIWADCGDVEVTYRADTKLYIQKINAPSDDDMTADTQIASGRYFIIGNTLYKSTTVIPAGDTVIPGTNCIKTNLAEALNALNT